MLTTIVVVYLSLVYFAFMTVTFRLAKEIAWRQTNELKRAFPKMWIEEERDER